MCSSDLSRDLWAGPQCHEVSDRARRTLGQVIGLHSAHEPVPPHRGNPAAQRGRAADYVPAYILKQPRDGDRWVFQPRDYLPEEGLVRRGGGTTPAIEPCFRLQPNDWQRHLDIASGTRIRHEFPGRFLL